MICLLFIAGLSGSVSASEQANDRVLQFQEFIESPPAVEAIYRKTWRSPARSATKLISPGTEFVTNSALFHLIWQDDAFLLRELRQPDDVHNYEIHGKCFIKYGDRCWDLDTGRRALIVEGDAGTEDNFVTSVMDERLFNIGEVLNLGVWLLKPKGIRWQKNRFEVTSNMHGEIRVRGVLALTKGVPEAIHLTAQSPTSVATHSIRYSYERTLSNALPSRIERFVERKGRCTLHSEIEILELRTYETPLAFARFDPNPFLEFNKSSQFLISNNVAYLRTPGGLKEAVRFPKRWSLFNINWVQRGAIIVIGGLFIAALILAVRISQRTNKQTHREKGKICSSV